MADEEGRIEVLVVDDKKNMLRLMTKVLEPEMEVTTVESGLRALDLLRSRTFDVILSDLRMPDLDGLELLEKTRTAGHGTAFILMTAYASVPTAVQALRSGAYDYITKPFDPGEAKALIRKAGTRAMMSRRFRGREDEVLPGMFARSPRMRELADLVRRIACTDTTVLILGETGTGKECVARALHRLSPRNDERFVALNCAAIPAELMESELFGFVKGSFSGANRDRKGLFEEARGGTLFLDEIGELPFSLQAKLTRVLEERAIRRIGDSVERDVDFRLLAATHRDLESMVAQGDFREDLWYRLNVASIEIPPLRERREDIAFLARFFLSRIAGTVNPSVSDFDEEALQIMKAQAWPGNVRQLKAAVERACIVATGREIQESDLPSEIRRKSSTGSVLDSLEDLPWEEAVKKGRTAMARAYLAAVLENHHGDVAAAALHARIKRESFYRLMRKYGIDPRRGRQETGDSSCQ